MSKHISLTSGSQGVLKVNQMVELRPGILDKTADGKTICRPIYSRIVSLFAEQNKLQFAVPGGLIGVGTSMDPSLSRSDMLVGQVLGDVGTLPEVYIELKVSMHSLAFLAFVVISFIAY